MSPPLFQRLVDCHMLYLYRHQQYLSDWIHIHGSPTVISGDVEFGKCKEFINFLNYHHIIFQAIKAHRHNKIDTVETKQTILLQIPQRLYQDALDAKLYPLIPVGCISPAKYLSNILYRENFFPRFKFSVGILPL